MAASSQDRELERGDGSSAAAPPLDPRSIARQRGASDGFSWRLSAFYAAMFVFAGIVLPFFPVWLAAKGLDSRATGIVLAVPMLMRLISVPLIARLADRWSAFRAVLIAASFGSALTYVLLSQVAGFVPILLAVALASLATAPGMPLTDAYALKGLGLRGRAYGPVRLWGSVAFVAANVGGGLVIDRIAPIDIIWLLVAALGVVAAVSLALRPLAPEISVPQAFGDLDRKLLLSPGFWAITAAAGLSTCCMKVLMSTCDRNGVGAASSELDGDAVTQATASVTTSTITALPQRGMPIIVNESAW